jgi:hypothetical protein
MATYPQELKFNAGSTPIPRGGRVIDLDGDGNARVRKLHGDRTDFVLVHNALDVNERATLLAFVAANGAVTFDLHWIDGFVYQVIFDEPPYSEEPHGAGLFRFSVNVKGSA